MNNTQTSNYSIQNNVNIPNNNDLRNTQTTFPNPNLNPTDKTLENLNYNLTKSIPVASVQRIKEIDKMIK